MLRISRAFSALLQAAVVFGWTWPNGKMERLDTLRFDQFDINSVSYPVDRIVNNL
jgi:hypothetical protein